MKKEDLEAILNGNIAHISEVNMYEDTDPNIEIIVMPIHVQNMLLAYLNKKITDEELNEWATFICFRGGGEYVCSDWENEESVDFYEDMFYVVQKLSTPEIDGEITPETVEKYLRELDKYFKTNDLEY